MCCSCYNSKQSSRICWTMQQSARWAAGKLPCFFLTNLQLHTCQHTGEPWGSLGLKVLDSLRSSPNTRLHDLFNKRTKANELIKVLVESIPHTLLIVEWLNWEKCATTAEILWLEEMKETKRQPFCQQMNHHRRARCGLSADLTRLGSLVTHQASRCTGLGQTHYTSPPLTSHTPWS